MRTRYVHQKSGEEKLIYKDLMSAFGKRVKQLSTDRKLSMEKLAELSDIDYR